MLAQDNFFLNQEKLKLIYLSILSLGIPLESWIIPQDQDQLKFIINQINKTLKQHDELIRRAVSLLEQIEKLNYADGYYGLVQEYLTKFEQLTQSHSDLQINLETEKKEAIAVKLLANLLFYSGVDGNLYLEQQIIQ
jgi:hypothetical protein